MVEPELETTQESPTYNLMPLPQARSEVWSYFGFLAGDEGQIIDKSRVICRICGLSFCYSGNTTNFYSHLRAIHSDINLKRSSHSGNSRNSLSSNNNTSTTNTSSNNVTNTKSGVKRAIDSDETVSYEEFQENNPPQTVQSISKSEITKTTNDEYYISSQRITETLVNFVVNDCRPVDVLYGQGFQKLLNLLAPGYLLPQKSRLLMDLRRRYDELLKEKNIIDIDKSLAS